MQTTNLTKNVIFFFSLVVTLGLGELKITHAAETDAILSGGADPAIIANQTADEKEGYYVISTGRGLNLSYSQDLKSWKRIGRIFDEDVPSWAKKAVSAATGLWAPDISYHNGKYYLYYSVSSLGSQRSVIGLAVNQSIDPQSPDYEWVDLGEVIDSDVGKGDYNAIDPALFVDDDGKWYLFLGSFWSGLKMVELDASTGKPRPDASLIPVAGRPKHPTHAIEAAFVIKRDDDYYLFASWDRCCEGADSDYKVVVGRSKKVSGPYVDREGEPMLEGGGTIILASEGRWRGPGHNSVLTTADGQWMAHHTYDVDHLDAQRILQIRPMSWTTDGWPQVGKPLGVH